jgi:hypothetical protein
MVDQEFTIISAGTDVPSIYLKFASRALISFTYLWSLAPFRLFPGDVLHTLNSGSGLRIWRSGRSLASVLKPLCLLLCVVTGWIRERTLVTTRKALSGGTARVLARMFHDCRTSLRACHSLQSRGYISPLLPLFGGGRESRGSEENRNTPRSISVACGWPAEECLL